MSKGPHQWNNRSLLGDSVEELFDFSATNLERLRPPSPAHPGMLEIPRSDTDQNGPIACYGTGARAKILTSSERSQHTSFRKNGAHPPNSPRTSVGSRRRVRHGAGAPRFYAPRPLWSGALTGRAHRQSTLPGVLGIGVLPYNYSGEFKEFPRMDG